MEEVYDALGMEFGEERVIRRKQCLKEDPRLARIEDLHQRIKDQNSTLEQNQTGTKIEIDYRVFY